MTSFSLPIRFYVFENNVSKSCPRCMAHLVFLAVASNSANADVTQVSGGLDGRALSHELRWNGGEEGARLHGAFLNLRHVISDAGGDRYILVGQLDADNNFTELGPYQVYGQVKGPLGRINLRAGRYILPFGLLANLDTERQLIQSLEPLSLGIKLDTGAQVFGFAGPLDYAASVSQGATDDANTLAVARVGRQGADGRWGVSYLDGRIDADHEEFLQQGVYDRRRLAVDAEIDLAPWLLRAELITGRDDGDAVHGGVLLADYDLNARLSLNSKLAGWNTADADRGNAREFALGVTYQLPHNVSVRAADIFQQRGDSDRHVFALQLYWDFSHGY